MATMRECDFDDLAAQYLTMFPVNRMKLTGVLHIHYMAGTGRT